MVGDGTTLHCRSSMKLESIGRIQTQPSAACELPIPTTAASPKPSRNLRTERALEPERLLVSLCWFSLRWREGPLR